VLKIPYSHCSGSIGIVNKFNTKKKGNYLISRIVYIASGLYSIYTTRLVEHI